MTGEVDPSVWEELGPSTRSRTVKHRLLLSTGTEITISEIGFDRINVYVSGRWAIRNLFVKDRANIELIRTDDLEDKRST